MKCENFDEYINMYLDGTLNEKQSEELNKHINSCEKCREEFTVIENMKKTIDGTEEKELPEGFHNELMEKIGNINKNNGKIIRFPVFKAAATAAAIAITVFACYNFGIDDFDKGVDINSLKASKSATADISGNAEKDVADNFGITNETENNTNDKIEKKDDAVIAATPAPKAGSEEKETQPDVVSEPISEDKSAKEIQTETVVSQVVEETQPEPTEVEPVAATAVEVQPEAYSVARTDTVEETTEEIKTDEATVPKISSGGGYGGGGGGSSAASVSGANTVVTVSLSQKLASLGYGENLGGAYRFPAEKYNEVMNILSGYDGSEYSIQNDYENGTFTVTVY